MMSKLLDGGRPIATNVFIPATKFRIANKNHFFSKLITTTMKNKLSQSQLKKLLQQAIAERDQPNVNYAAPTRCSDLGFYKLGFNSDGTIALWESIEDRYKFAVEASSYHEAYIKVLELLISRCKD